MMDVGELGHYSCTKLLRGMEAMDSDAKNDGHSMNLVDFELVTLLEELCAKLWEAASDMELPKDLYLVPGVAENDQVMDEPEVIDGKEGSQKKNSGKWGPVLVNKKPSRT
jgi:hypothetical protein